MADNVTTSNTQAEDNTGPIQPFESFAPIEHRRMIQRQIQHSVDQSVDRAMTFSIGDFDGRFISNFPAPTRMRENDEGYMYHLVGLNRGGDMSVAAP
jgi:hypothetical protein